MLPSKVSMRDYQDRTYLSAVEAAKFLDVSVSTIHRLTKKGDLAADLAASGQKRYRLADLEARKIGAKAPGSSLSQDQVVERNGTTQRVIVADSRHMHHVADESVHLMLTSPPYFNAKMYSQDADGADLGNVHDLDAWFKDIGGVWAEVYRVLQPGRKAFINIMNLPVRTNGSFRSLNLVGRTIDVCESLGFIFKRDIIWHKTNGVRAHFGSYPDPGGLLLNHMHEFILEFHKPDRRGAKKYAHVTPEQKEASKLDKEFWLSLKNSDVWTMRPEGSGDNRSHVAPFPPELPERLIRGYSFVGETVLDPFAGSCVALRIAAELRRNGVGYEINPDIARDGLAQLHT